ncbi:hydroxyisourate hydrolase [Grimontia sp. S25]|uniref:5-hydroxyisourate hydrolase n=1 Tax=Grimontia sedimenti TaxID=2711294 RepID=A0A6M1RIY2_9GAMM|nr:hydroxyisourate hydrolase [Grimontia sedimenti]NGN99402.1 hydroxyisourate hydrolase [Grimontia sedimenti]
MGKLTTHVLDTARGKPAQGVKISLYRIDEEGLHPVTTSITNDDGRTDTPLIEEGYLISGQYQLVFATASYFQHTNAQLDAIPFLDEIVIRFGVSDHNQHYHVPLLVSPYGYSTYRGS